MTQAPPPVSPVCYRHPKRETYVRCSRCERYICPDCMVDAAVGHQCPECVSEGRSSVRQARTQFGGSTVGEHGYVTKALIAINALVFIVSVLPAGIGGMFGGGMGGLLGGSTALLDGGSVIGADRYVDGAGHTYLGPGGVSAGEYYRLFTAMFLHIGILHLVVNMWALWIFGCELERRFGPVRFAILYLVAGIGGNVAVYLLSPSVGAAGSSTAIFGLFAALFIVLRRARQDIRPLIPVFVVNVFISLVPGISWVGHLGGFITGGVVAAAMAYAPAKSRNLVTSSVIAGLMVIFTVLVIIQTAALQKYVPI